jgi:hypothetical protein
MAPFFGQAQTNPPTPAELPKVLLMGDSIATGYTLPVRKLLEGKATVADVPKGGHTTTLALQSLLTHQLGDELASLHTERGSHGDADDGVNCFSGRMKEWMIQGAESVAFTYSRKPALWKKNISFL